MLQNKAGGPRTGRRDSKKARDIFFESELSAMIAVATSCGVARTGGTFAAASVLCGVILVFPDETVSPHAALHGGSVVTSVGGDVAAGIASVVETLPSFAW